MPIMLDAAPPGRGALAEPRRSCREGVQYRRSVRDRRGSGRPTRFDEARLGRDVRDRQRVPAVDLEAHRVLDNEWIDSPPFTLIVATDQPGTLLKALKQRIVLPFTLEYYADDEMRQIAMNYAAEIGVRLTAQAATRIAEAARAAE